jgi:cyclophilin family peptidyl-prolyl cis-trans isomerase
MKRFLIFLLLFSALFAQKKTEVVVLETDMGKIYIQVFDKETPTHAKNFKKLARQGFFNGLQFHRVIPGFVIQGGDPNSRDNNFEDDGAGGPGYTLPAEIKIKHLKGYVGMARESDKVNPKRRSSGSQFYICLRDLPRLDGKYTVFGRVVKGMDVVEKIAMVPTNERDHPIKPVRIKKAYVTKIKL